MIVDNRELTLVKAALAALEQKRTFETDIDYAKRCLMAALGIVASRCKCDLSDTPDAPRDWHYEGCPMYQDLTE